jgi:hypothetical protein
MKFIDQTLQMVAEIRNKYTPNTLPSGKFFIKTKQTFFLQNKQGKKIRTILSKFGEFEKPGIAN